MPFKLPKETTFAPADNEGKNVTLVDIETDESISVNVQYGLVVDEDGAIKGHRFYVSQNVVFMGRDTLLEAGAVDAGKAIETFIETELRRDPADYEIEGLDDEYFEQKYKKPAEDKHDPWTASKFADVREQLESLRGDTETALQTVMDKDTDSQAARVELAGLIKEAHTLVGGDRKALTAWSQGASKADGENMALLSKLGKGQNALYEAMLFATVPDAVMAVTPNGITSGKGLQRHMSVSVKEIVDLAQPNKVAGVDFSADAPDIDGVETLLTHTAQYAFGMSNASDSTTDAMIDAVEAAAGNNVGEFLGKYGKHVNTYDTQEYLAAKIAMGCVLVSSVGGGLYKAGWDAVNAYYDLDEDDGEGRKKVLAGLFSKTGGNALLKELYKAAKEHAAKVAAEDQNRKAVAAAAASDGAVFSKTAKSSFSTLDPLAAAAEVYAMIQEHAKPNEVENALRGLMTQGVTVKVAAE